MDKFTFIVGALGILLLIIALVLIISAFVNTIRGKKRFKKFLTALVVFLIVFGFATSFIYLSLFLRTFSRYTHEQRIGWIFADKTDTMIAMTFYDETKNSTYCFNLSGDQWIVEGYFLRWSTLLRWAGAESYYRVTRFTGRWEDKQQILTTYEVHPAEKLWKFLLKHGEQLPIVDAAYGIGVFQYPQQDTFYLYINDTGFILKNH
jgi:hypothetical protein